jgi:hypothetical protein
MRRGLSAAAAIAAAGLICAAPASPGVPGPTVSLGSAGGFEYLKATFPVVASQQAGAPVDCDVGDGVIGGGGSISGNGANAALNASYPTGFEGEGWIAEGSSSSSGRTVTTYAICGPDPFEFSNANGTLEAAGGDLDTSTDSQGCPAEQTLYGVNGSGGEVRILQLRPATNGLLWTSTVQNLADINAEYTVWYSCIEGLDPVLRQSDTVSVKPGDAGKATARCKAGEAVTAGGLFSAVGGQPRRDTWATSTRPYDSKDNKKTPDDGWTIKVQNGRDGGRTNIAAYAVCQEKS